MASTLFIPISRVLPKLVVAVLCLVSVTAFGAQTLPKPPSTGYVADEAGILSSQTETRLNQMLDQFEKETSNEIFIAVYRKLPPNVAFEELTVDSARQWKVGQGDRNNGIVFFVFVEDRKLAIEVGYGLEGAVPDAIANRIKDEIVVPAFRSGRFEEGIVQGTAALMAASRGEYKGTGKSGGPGGRRGIPIGAFILIFIVISILSSAGRRRGVYYGGRRHRPAAGWALLTMMSAMGGGGRSSGGGWGGGGGGGGFGGVGGGGSFGGGGARGGW